MQPQDKGDAQEREQTKGMCKHSVSVATMRPGLAYPQRSHGELRMLGKLAVAQLAS